MRTSDAREYAQAAAAHLDRLAAGEEVTPALVLAGAVVSLALSACDLVDMLTGVKPAGRPPCDGAPSPG